MGSVAVAQGLVAVRTVVDRVEVDQVEVVQEGLQSLVVPCVVYGA
jgi:hypothetical protein